MIGFSDTTAPTDQRPKRTPPVRYVEQEQTLNFKAKQYQIPTCPHCWPMVESGTRGCMRCPRIPSVSKFLFLNCWHQILMSFLSCLIRFWLARSGIEPHAPRHRIRPLRIMQDHAPFHCRQKYSISSARALRIALCHAISFITLRAQRIQCTKSLSPKRPLSTSYLYIRFRPTQLVMVDNEDVNFKTGHLMCLERTIGAHSVSQPRLSAQPIETIGNNYKGWSLLARNRTNQSEHKHYGADIYSSYITIA